MIPLSKLIILRWQHQPTPSNTNPGSKSSCIHGKAYFYCGLMLIAAFVLQEYTGNHWPWLAHLQTSNRYMQISGFTLAGYIALQWRCSMLRNQGLMQKAAKALNQHKQLGALAPLFFYAHSQHIGYAYLQVLSLAYFSIFLTGLGNAEITGIHKPWFRKVWIAIHVGTATSLVFLLGYHVYISYAYQ